MLGPQQARTPGSQRQRRRVVRLEPPGHRAVVRGPRSGEARLRREEADPRPLRSGVQRRRLRRQLDRHRSTPRVPRLHPIQPRPLRAKPHPRGPVGTRRNREREIGHDRRQLDALHPHWPPGALRPQPIPPLAQQHLPRRTVGLQANTGPKSASNKAVSSGAPPSPAAHHPTAPTRPGPSRARSSAATPPAARPPPPPAASGAAPPPPPAPTAPAGPSSASKATNQALGRQPARQQVRPRARTRAAASVLNTCIRTGSSEPITDNAQAPARGSSSTRHARPLASKRNPCVALARSGSRVTARATTRNVPRAPPKPSRCNR